MKLSRLADAATDLKISMSSGIDPEIGSIHYLAQDVRQGGLFVAVKGFSANGHDFIETAVRNGAAAVLVEEPPKIDIPYIHVQNTRAAMGRIAAAFYGNPGRKLCLIGVTGTNGKTTVSYLVEGILTAAGYRTGVTGTINYRFCGKRENSPVTTPESLDIQRMLAEMVDAGVTHVVLEVSSHGLELGRIEGLDFNVGVFTNLSRDHLDFHGDMRRYWHAKKSFFTRYIQNKDNPKKPAAVINTDAKKGRELHRELAIPVWPVSQKDDGRISARSVQFSLDGIAGELIIDGKTAALRSRMVGKHNLENILCAAGVGAALGISIDKIQAGILAVTMVPGRLEPVTGDWDCHVFVDYAHTPDALENALSALKPLTKNRLISVFGAGGDRDRGKRPLMGEISGRLANFSVVTSDNPRSEPPDVVVNEVAAGILSGQYVKVPDRERAIRTALEAAETGDAVLISGKGHEQYQVVGKVTIPFDDRKVAAGAWGLLKENDSDPPFWTSSRLAEASGGMLVCGEHSTDFFRDVIIDSRDCGANDVFLALAGERHDAHRFIDTAVLNGAKALVLQKDRLEDLPVDAWRRKGLAVFAVADTTRALGDLAAFRREKSPVGVVAITGTNGKTTTRTMAGHVMSAKGPALIPERNFNNHIGLPLTLLSLQPGHLWAVLELGMNHFGEIHRLSGICRPDIAVITNIGPGHLEGVGSIEGVMTAKSEIFDFLHPKGTAVLNMDDPYSRKIGRDLKRHVLWFGRSEKADIHAEDIRQNKGGLEFILKTPVSRTNVTVKARSLFMVDNALAAAAVGYLTGLSVDEIAAGLAEFETIGGRMVFRETSGGIHLIDDTYNANPASMKAALAELEFRKNGRSRSFFICGDMLELGKASEKWHRELGETATNSGVDFLFAAGDFADVVVEGAKKAGMKPENMISGSKEEITQHLTSRLRPGDWLLVKGSRGSAMETVVRSILDSDH